VRTYSLPVCLSVCVPRLPSKSTFFNAITNSATAAENYPFCTIGPQGYRCCCHGRRYTH
jgi:obg-like ATPase 1